MKIRSYRWLSQGQTFICKCFSSSAKCLNDSGSRRGRVAVVGSGPAAFYCLQTLLRKWDDCTVDVYEKLPVPYGLIRYGIAPDHPEVKNCINQFEKTVQSFSARFRFYGNVEVGKDVKIKELMNAYHVVLLAYGSENENRLGVSGENSTNCFSARSFVGWYNGRPDMKNLKVQLSDVESETAVVLGHGNVALDVARMLLLPIDQLRKTDIAEHALQEISKSRIRRVVLVGRRGPLQVSFTTAELREMTKLPQCRSLFRLNDFSDLCADPKILEKLDRPRRRLTQLMLETAKKANFNLTSSTSNEKSWELKFLLTPTRILARRRENVESVSGIEFDKNRLLINDNKYSEAKIVPIGQSETIDCSLVIYSIGYKTENIEIGTLPFNEKSNVLKTSDNFARIEGLKGVYGCGWCVTGPRGVLATTQSVAAGIASLIMEDIKNGLVELSADKLGSSAIEKILRTRDIRWTSWDDWKRIDDHERKNCSSDGEKPRSKIVEKNVFLSFSTSR